MLDLLCEKIQNFLSKSKHRKSCLKIPTDAMINDIWYRVFYYLTQHRDVFNVASVDHNFRQLLEKKLCDFPWYKYHIIIKNSHTRCENQRGTYIMSYVCTRMGLRFVLREENEKYFIFVTDYIGLQQEIEIVLTTNFALSSHFTEFIDKVGIILIHNSKENYVPLDPGSKQITFCDSNEKFYSYQVQITSSLSKFDDDTNVHKLVHVARTCHVRKTLVIFIDYYRKLYSLTTNIIRLCVKKTNDQKEVLEVIANYHLLPLTHHRFFVVQLKKQIYFICLTIHKIDNADVAIDIIHQVTDHSNNQYLLSYSHCAKNLTIVKDFGDRLKIIKEIPFDDDQI